MKKYLSVIISALVAFATAIAVSGCQSGASNIPDIDIHSLAEDMRASTELPDMLSVKTGDDIAESAFGSISDIEYDKIDEYTLFYASDGTAYELAVIKLKSADDMGELEKSLNAHIENRVKQYRYYNPEEAPRAESALVVNNGRYAALIMCDNVAAVKAAFEKAFS